MKNDTPDLEHCKQLSEAGWKKKTAYCRELDSGKLFFWHDGYTDDRPEILPAPLLTELLRELPKQYLEDVYGKMDLALIYDEYGDAHCGYMIGDTLIYLVSDPNPCNAAAGLWVWKEKRK